MPTMVVAPMLHAQGRSPYTEVSAAVRYQDEDYIVSVAELAVIDARRLNMTGGDLRDYEDAIRRALDRLFTGF